MIGNKIFTGIMLASVFALFFHQRLVKNVILNEISIQLIKTFPSSTEWPAPYCGEFQSSFSIVNNLREERILAYTARDNKAKIIIAKWLWANGHCGDAFDLWQKVEFNGTLRSDFARFEWGRALFSENRYSDAIEVMSETDIANLIRLIGEKRFSNGFIEDAENFFWLAFELQKDLKTADLLTTLYLQQDKTGQAKQVWLEIVSTTPVDDAIYWVAVAEAASLDKDWVIASISFQKAAQLSSDPYQTYLRLANMLYVAQRWSEVITACETIIQLASNKVSSEPYVLAARAAIAIGDYELAIDWVDRALQAGVYGNPWPDIVAAQAYEKMDDLENARHRYQNALNQVPYHYYASLNLSLLEYRAGNLEEAISYLIPLSQSSNCQILEYLIAWNDELGVDSVSYRQQHSILCTQ